MDMDDFSSRFKVQKYFYFGERFGLNLDYVYNLYKRGPYSPSLAAAAFSVLEDDSFLDEELLTEETKILKRTTDFVEGLSERDLEVITTLDYLVSTNYDELNQQEIVQKLHRLKEWTKEIPEEKLNNYWKRLVEFGLIESP
jgi:uncharacterized protein YwgA